LSHKPVSHFIRILAKAAARGGNILMNVGPMGNGKMDPKDVAILKGIGKWMDQNAESIRGTTKTLLPVQTWGESTRKDNKIYLHVFDWPTTGKLVVGGLKSTVTKASLLSGSNHAGLKVTRLSPLDVSIVIPKMAPDTNDTVLVLECTDAEAADSARLLQ